MLKRLFFLPMMFVIVSSFFFAASARADDGLAAWLRYAPLTPQEARHYETLPRVVYVAGDSVIVRSAANELTNGLTQMLGANVSIRKPIGGERVIVLGPVAEIRKLGIQQLASSNLKPDGFSITSARLHGSRTMVITAGNERGVLYGVFALLSKIARGEPLDGINETQQPSAPVRWVNQWDNLDGTIERGYGGRSIFFDQGAVRVDLTRAQQYGRLLASVGINGCTVNNVNTDNRVLDDKFLPQLARIADVFRPWGVQLSISVDLTSPKTSGALDTFDPLDPRVQQWWRAKAESIYKLIPDFGGFVVKADSEGRAGPTSYGRTPADAANVIARALKPNGGLVFYRAFVYNHHLDWRDAKADRARAAYDIFHPLDGKFDDNVIIQIKNGPIDFQVREPVSPLFAGLERTNSAIELQVTQEYTGQQRHLCFLVPMWKEALDFDLRVGGEHTPLKQIVSGQTFQRRTGGYVGVANVGLDSNWLGSTLAMANLYGFARLAWNPDLASSKIVEDWTRLTFGNDPIVVKTISEMQLGSWSIYESYTGPLGAGTLTDILGSHFEPAPESSERNGWGQWHRADHDGIGMDRTVATGTGYTGQYPPEVQKLYESVESCPDELLLFFHHVRWKHKLHSGKTVIQHIYDSHYNGAARAQKLVAQWQTLKDRVDDERYQHMLKLLQFQAQHAIVWRDTICKWAFEQSGIPAASSGLRSEGFGSANLR